MPENFIPLDDIRVAAPCHASWDNMSGGDTTRFCQTCRKNVYNLSKMSRAEAEALVRDKEGNLCVRFYRRADGTLLTNDCPVGVQLVRRPLKWLGAAFAFLLAPIFAWNAVLVAGKGRPPSAPELFAAPSATPTPQPTSEPTPAPRWSPPKWPSLLGSDSQRTQSEPRVTMGIMPMPVMPAPPVKPTPLPAPPSSMPEQPPLHISNQPLPEAEDQAERMARWVLSNSQNANQQP